MNNRVAEFQNELKAFFEWSKQERLRIIEQLKSESRYNTGLDANQEEFASFIKESERRFKEIAVKYSDLPPDTKLKAD